MKFNLKNRPKKRVGFNAIQYEHKAEEWFEGFEQELRETLTDPLAEHGLCEQTKYLIKEVLGE